jgi:hypothetical protein
LQDAILSKLEGLSAKRKLVSRGPPASKIYALIYHAKSRRTRSLTKRVRRMAATRMRMDSEFLLPDPPFPRPYPIRPIGKLAEPNECEQTVLPKK